MKYDAQFSTGARLGTPRASGEEIRRGTLCIVSTPIGNLDDITLRAIKILSSVDLIAAEDTRTTKILLNHFHIQKPLVSYFSYNEARRTPELIDKLKDGCTIALVSDAGTPGISDPSYRVIRAALDEKLPVVAIPGPSAFLPALISSGLPMDRFIFEGFLPVKKGRKTVLEKLRSEERTIILYESPHRLPRTLHDLLETLGDRQISVSRELTKKFEETVRGSISSVILHFTTHTIRGEFVLVVAGAG
ncbi:MAG: 16S rRNA (cytidine(1402)-2'-O)-methyltransferase [Ignavibacteriae bacterium]|nr:16S rRNA (cytidine(1402)-2'-O)-methyltransferase [Ignavibacteria bacterium]MBI3364520.1 16S rRNA (cytidine(1402)-2'-O)-methyltransferase [Ignavibacteriota bacterium]